MNRYFKLKPIILLMILVFFSGFTFSQEINEESNVKMEPLTGISVTLSVYSGNPNPQWWITEGPEFEKFFDLLKSMKTVNDSIFNYNEWNRLGYATFRIVPREITELPKSVHIWRDMAVISQYEEENLLYADGVTALYDLLVKQAEERGHEEFFINYHKQKR